MAGPRSQRYWQIRFPGEAVPLTVYSASVLREFVHAAPAGTTYQRFTAVYTERGRLESVTGDDQITVLG